MRWTDRRLIVVEGKGGVGRTTVTAALALAAGRLGRRTCAVELSGEGALSHRLGMGQPRYETRTVAPNVDLMSLSPGACMADFGQRKLHLGPVIGWLLDNRAMTGFIESVPGLQDVVQLGKVENRLNEPLDGEAPYDLMVLDGPATGHGLTLLASARSMRQMTRSGPFHDLAGIIEKLLDNRDHTATWVITLPEALPVHETLELLQALVAEGAVPDAIVVNQTEPAPFLLPDDQVLATLRGADPATTALRNLAEQAMAAAHRQKAALTMLTDRLPAAAGHPLPVLHLPRLDDPGEGPAGLNPLVRALINLAQGAP